MNMFNLYSPYIFWLDGMSGGFILSKNKILWSMSFAQFLAMQVWFNFSAVMPYIEREWELTSSQSGLIIAFFQIGYVVAIIIYSILIEKYDPKYFIIYGALAAGVSGIIFVFFAQGILTAMFLRMISGIGIAGIYVPGVKILTGLFSPRERGKAIGIYVGSGFSILVSSLLIEEIGWRGVILLTSSFSIVAALFMNRIKIPSIKNLQTPLKLQWGVLKTVFQKRNFLVNGGYARHSWELYAMWAWIGPYLIFYFTIQGFEQAAAIRFWNMAGAVVIMIGGIATYMGGGLSDSIGRIKTANSFLFISIVCSLSIGWLVTLPLVLMLILVFIYGFTIVADSPIYNVTIAEVAEPEVVGLAFTVIGIGTLVAPICMLFLSKPQN